MSDPTRSEPVAPVDGPGGAGSADTSAPTAPVPPQAVLPALYATVAAVLAEAVASVEAQGKEISCCAGCGACCRQLVPISDVEARAIADLVERLPQPRRAEIEARFAEAERRIAAWRSLDALLDPDIDAPNSEQARIAVDYFRLGVACPFLEDESCSIYPDRPLLCREYLVTSPASNCAQLSELPTDAVPLTRPSWSLARLTSDETPPRPVYVPLSLSLYWRRQRGGDFESRPLAAWAARFEAASRHVLEKLAQAPAGSVAARVRGTFERSP